LDQGRLVEFDHPATLLKDDKSEFSKLVRETGRSMTRQLTRMANVSKSKSSALLEPIEVVMSEGEEEESVRCVLSSGTVVASFSRYGLQRD
jgi:hypothetical protein